MAGRQLTGGSIRLRCSSRATTLLCGQLRFAAA